MKLSEGIQQQAASCVKCGLCLPHCPTYKITQNECESPRGRIALMEGLATKQIPFSQKPKILRSLLAMPCLRNGLPSTSSL